MSTNTIIFTGALLNSYASGGMAQVIKVPQYTTLTVNAGGMIVPKIWKDTIVSTVRYRFGGIVALYASTIVNNGTITATGAGFRGGQLDIVNTAAYTPGVTKYVSLINSDGGEKGESIAGYQPEYDLMNGRYGRGAPANGGGGGNGWNAGGGGGCNGDNGNTWTGQGVMVVNSSNPITAWQLDPGYIANGNSLTTSSGGGRGGYSVGFVGPNPTTTPPGNFAWSADNRREVGGLGGRPLNNITAINRIYFGGGGGAGDENNLNGGAGGTGGGIIYLVADNNISGIGTISANGNNGFNTTGSGLDAPGGGGGGGSVILKAVSIGAGQTITANGGKGGDQFISSSSECEGPAGGGGGGFVGITSATLIPSVNGSIGGSTNASMMTLFPFDGSTSGAPGQSAIITNQFIVFDMASIVLLSSNSAVCAGGTLNLSATNVTGATYNWSGPNSFTSTAQNPFLNNVQNAASGIYTLSVIVGSCPALTSTIQAVVSDCTGIKTPQDNEVSAFIYPNPGSGIVFVKNAGNNFIELYIYNSIGSLVKQETGIIKELDLCKLSKGIYNVIIKQNSELKVQKFVVE